jgi:hypothetical protein
MGRMCTHRVGIHETRKKELPMFKDVRSYLIRPVLSKDVLESRLWNVLFDPDDFTGCINGEQTPGQRLER